MGISPGRTLGPYEVVESLGQGGMGAVYKVYHPQLNVYRAAKVILPDHNEEAWFQARFKKEAQAVARLRHPHILTIHDFGEDHGLAYLVADLVDGGDLAERVGMPLPIASVVSLLNPIASALDYAHACGVVHRDVKPSNILLYADETPVLADFGIAKSLNATVSDGQGTRLAGTPAYMAPEQVDGERASPASDQYALGCVAYELLTGQVPFTGPTPEAMLMARLVKAPVPPRSINPTLSPAVERVLVKALSRRPEDRYPSVSAFTTALSDAALMTPSGAPSPRRLAVYCASGFAVLLILAGVLLFRGSTGQVTALAVSTPTLSATATPSGRPAIKVDQPVHGTLNAPGEQASYSFTASANEVVLLSIDKQPFGLWVEARIFNPDGTTLCWVKDFAPAPVNCRFPRSGAYLVVVHADSPSTTGGDYTLHLVSVSP